MNLLEERLPKALYRRPDHLALCQRIAERPSPVFAMHHSSPSWGRAGLTRSGKFHERGEDRMVEVLTELEADELLRLQVIDRLLQW